MSTAKKFFSAAEKNAIVNAIRKAESQTSSEIRVHVEDNCESDVINRAIAVFNKIGMQKTPLRNAVLIYIAVADRKFAVIGDEAMNNKVAPDYWTTISMQLGNSFKNGHYGKGVMDAIETIAATLSAHFPILKSDTNDLPDDISFE
jgi:uncharacterized membrane protein